PPPPGRSPATWPHILLEAGSVLVGGLGPAVMGIEEHAQVSVVDGDVVVGGEVVASGKLQTERTVAANMAAAREGLAAEIERFAENTMTYLRRERGLLLDWAGGPDNRT